MRRSPHFLFVGRVETDERYVYALCDRAGIATHGTSEEQAFARMGAALDLYVKTLGDRGELVAAVKEGKVGVELLPWRPGEAGTRVQREGDGFRAALGSVA